MYGKGDYDLAGFCVGAVERDKVLTGKDIAPGDVVLGLASSGVHSNGFSLVRRIIAERGWDLREPMPSAEGKTLAEVLLEPTRIYVRALLPLVQQGMIKGLAHITGGGLLENIPRVLPDDCHAVIDTELWPLPPVFEMLRDAGELTPEELVHTFNCGIGMAVIISRQQLPQFAIGHASAPETYWHIGHITDGRRGCTVTGEDWSATYHA
jgi:phosphoribosylformylglycinamidine cyclo-ligase